MTVKELLQKLSAINDDDRGCEVAFVLPAGGAWYVADVTTAEDEEGSLLFALIPKADTEEKQGGS